MTRNRLALICVGMCSLVLVAAACDDGGDEDPTPAPSATLAPTQAGPTRAATAIVTVEPGVTPSSPIAIELTADPPRLLCDGKQISKVTALVVDALNHLVEDGTAVHFEVVALGTADPIDTKTAGGTAKTSVVALGSNVGVVVNVTAGEAAASIRVDCQ